MAKVKELQDQHTLLNHKLQKQVEGLEAENSKLLQLSITQKSDVKVEEKHVESPLKVDKMIEDLSGIEIDNS